MPTAPHRHAALIVVLAGVCAALHIGKLPPAIPALQAALGLTLVQAGFLLALVQTAGMTLGLVFGAFTESLGARRSLLAGLLLISLASAAGALAPGVGWLMASRAVEGLGFLLVVLPAPGLARSLADPARADRLMGLWGAYMPTGTALALALGPLVMHTGAGWRGWWLGLALVTLAMAGWLSRAVPRPASQAFTSASTPMPVERTAPPLARRIGITLGAAGPWLVALPFAFYAAQWMALFGFLPALVQQAGAGTLATGALTALAAAVNIVGNVGAGRALQRGVPAVRLLGLGFGAMAAGALIAFAPWPPLLRYTGVLLFSGCGGLVPATLFAQAARLAPPAGGVATTMGFVQQSSAFGQFVGPPLVAWLAARAGGWQFTGLTCAAWALAGLLLGLLLGRRIAAQVSR